MFYKLVYESGKEIVHLSGTTDPFVLYKYKEELGKDYKRMTLFLCSEYNLERATEDEDLNFSCDEMDNVTSFPVTEYNDILEEGECIIKKARIDKSTDIDESVIILPRKSLTFQKTSDMIQHLSDQINKDGSFFIVVKRNGTIWINLSVWQRQRQLSDINKKLMVSFIGEIGIDDGALSREFLTTMMNGIKLEMFPNGAPVDSMTHLNNGNFCTCGKIVSFSICQGGPPPLFLHQNCYNQLVNPDIDFQNLSTEKHLTDSEKETLVKVKSDPTSHADYIFEHSHTGTIKVENVDQIVGTITTSIVNRSKRYLQEFLKGMLFNISKIIIENSELCKELFLQSDTNFITSGFLLSITRPVYSEEGSSRRHIEEMVMDLFQDFLFEVENKQLKIHEAPMAFDCDDVDHTCMTEKAELSVPGILQWITGAAHKPIDGRELTIKVNFNHDCFADFLNHTIGCPIVRSCTNEITLPIAHMKNIDNFKWIFMEAFTFGQSFA